MIKRIFEILLVVILVVLGFGLYQHDFDFNEYTRYLSQDGANNFVKNFSFASPATWLNFLYPFAIDDATTDQNDDLSAIEKELEALANQTITEDEIFGTTGETQPTSGTIKTGANLGSGEVLSGNMLSGNTFSGNLPGSSGSLHSGNMLSGDDTAISGEQNTGTTQDDVDRLQDELDDLDEQDFDDFFGDDEDTGATTGETANTGTTNTNTDTGSGMFTFSGDIETGSVMTGDAKTGLDTTTGKEEIIYTGNYTGLLQKRLEQYKAFKKTLSGE